MEGLDKTTSVATQGLSEVLDKTMPKGDLPKSSETAGSPSGKDVLLFSQVLEANQKISPELIQSLGIGQETIPTIKSAAATDVQVDPKGFTDHKIETKDKIADILSDVNRGQLQMDGIMEVALSGRHFSPPELLAMQAGVYQIAQEMELASKVFEQVNNAHRTIWNTNFQG
ncbi:MAG: hypothetical protein Q7S98_03535 [Deltaproteobacteria bacterium]|nr:hypothetical protein [Deltaproteobacteria bacterium]